MKRMYTVNQIKKIVDEEAVNALLGKDISVDDLDATGKITGNEIVENMSGYSFELKDLTSYGVTLTNVYTSAVKNGNKLTIVAYVKVNNASATTRLSTIDFIVPSAVGAKLYPQTIGSLDNVVSFGKTIAFKGVATTDVIDARYTFIKYDNANFAIQLFFADFDDLGEDYLVRIEQTFLLSDNLISE